ncbi:hypothetical protein [Pontibacillus salipaludis]|uniref:Uncharacterized protein n=1 Tax=Pontibacillus salipaludis TaxID=1697394 RepID=A0ABQ1QJD4_9BACI|nr:hypothetical protein [Pontibacillus salipaludis]GGD29137.1 hypothetical protein GCM10011389_40850 [Pontibacillus salipaludis]
MARKTRSLASFSDVANEDVNNDINKEGKHENKQKDNDSRPEAEKDTNVSTNIDIDKDTNDKININVNDEVNVNNDSEDFLDSLIQGKKKKKKPVLTGVYLDPEVAKVLNELGKKVGKGDGGKSRIVNDALKEVFTKKGLL